jgi:hypothetical protein
LGDASGGKPRVLPHVENRAADVVAVTDEVEIGLIDARHAIATLWKAAAINRDYTLEKTDSRAVTSCQDHFVEGSLAAILEAHARWSERREPAADGDSTGADEVS